MKKWRKEYYRYSLGNNVFIEYGRQVYVDELGDTEVVIFK